MSDQLPAGLDEFLEKAGWGGAKVEPLARRRQLPPLFPRARSGGRSAMLMDAPPPHEDPRPFLDVGKWLAAHGHRAPAIHAERPRRAGWC